MVSKSSNRQLLLAFGEVKKYQLSVLILSKINE